MSAEPRLEYVTRPLAARAVHEAAGWRVHSVTAVRRGNPRTGAMRLDAPVDTLILRRPREVA